MMSDKIRLGCLYCDRNDFDGVDELPADWEDIGEVRSYGEASKPIAADDMTRSVLDWQTHLGTCPECRAMHL